MWNVDESSRGNMSAHISVERRCLMNLVSTLEDNCFEPIKGEVDVLVVKVVV